MKADELSFDFGGQLFGLRVVAFGVLAYGVLVGGEFASRRRTGGFRSPSKESVSDRTNCNLPTTVSPTRHSRTKASNSVHFRL